jgi:NosR/NirI family transcriptional regulator, nitrous oxide reductase regulator
MLTRYFRWLQNDVPVGDVERLPEIDKNGETSVRGIYVIGDLTGIPLLKLSAENGAERIRSFVDDKKYMESRENKDNDILDFVIVGGGPAGISAGLEAQKHDFKFKILESSRTFSTIANLPKGKPICAEPENISRISDLKIEEGVKETLLEDLFSSIRDKNLPIHEGASVEHIVQKNDYFEIQTQTECFKALRVLLATGKSGNSRMLGVPGEESVKVFNRMIDPMDTRGHHVLVVGGGDTALETAIAVAEFADSVTLSYRKASFARTGEENIQQLNRLAEAGKIKLLMESNVKEIRPDSVVLSDKNNKEFTIDNSMVYVHIGKIMPLEFFRRINVKIEGVMTFIEKWMFFCLLMFSGVVYFGKSSVQAILSRGGEAVTVTSGEVLNRLLMPEFWAKFLVYPFKGGFFENADKWNWYKSLYGIIGYLCFLGFIVSAVVVLVYFLIKIRTFTSSAWKSFKSLYFITVAAFFMFVYVGSTYFGVNVLEKNPGFWYTFLYSLTILIFGLRRMAVNPTRYIKRQTWTLILIQVIPLFLLPEFILPFLKQWGLLGGENGFLLTQVFPNGELWRSYGFVLFWPLFLHNLFTGSVTTFWLIYTILSTFALIPLLSYFWGKGAYCGWICSYGAMAETLGDEYRHSAPHGTGAKKWENAGQWVLLAAVLITGLKLVTVLGDVRIPFIHEPHPMLLDISGWLYYFVVDIIFAGVLGLGVYFFMSGRVWCRFFCPLAALMHIYTRFSRYRIFSDKKKCISCNICTRVCHMGIDVMSYANKGVPMNDVQCVRCSACVVNCPTECLYFGSQPKVDLDNAYYKTNELPKLDKSKWEQGIS